MTGTRGDGSRSWALPPSRGHRVTLLTPERLTTSSGVEPARRSPAALMGALVAPGPAPVREHRPDHDPDQDQRQVGDHEHDQGGHEHHLDQHGERAEPAGGPAVAGVRRTAEGWAAERRRRVRAAAARPVLADGRAVGRGVRRRGAVRAAGQVGEDRRQVGAGLGRPDPVEPVAVLLRRDPALRVVLGQLLGRRGAVGVADPQLTGLARLWRLGSPVTARSRRRRRRRTRPPRRRPSGRRARRHRRPAGRRACGGSR